MTLHVTLVLESRKEDLIMTQPIKVTEQEQEQVEQAKENIEKYLLERVFTKGTPNSKRVTNDVFTTVNAWLYGAMPKDDYKELAKKTASLLFTDEDINGYFYMDLLKQLNTATQKAVDTRLAALPSVKRALYSNFSTEFLTINLPVKLDSLNQETWASVTLMITNPKELFDCLGFKFKQSVFLKRQEITEQVANTVDSFAKQGKPLKGVKVFGANA